MKNLKACQSDFIKAKNFDKKVNRILLVILFIGILIQARLDYLTINF